jgi:hypothetical protein
MTSEEKTCRVIGLPNGAIILSNLSKVWIVNLAEITNLCVELSCSGETDSYSATQELSIVLWDLKAHYRVENLHILCQIDTVHATLPYHHPLVTSSRILITLIRIYFPYLKAVSSDRNLRMHHDVVSGNSLDVLNSSKIKWF